MSVTRGLPKKTILMIIVLLVAAYAWNFVASTTGFGSGIFMPFSLDLLGFAVIAVILLGWLAKKF